MLSESPSRSLRGSLLNTYVVMFHLCITLAINKSDGTHVKASYATFNTCKCASAGPKKDFQWVRTNHAIQQSPGSRVFIV